MCVRIFNFGFLVGFMSICQVFRVLVLSIDYGLFENILNMLYLEVLGFGFNFLVNLDIRNKVGFGILKISVICVYELVLIKYNI